MIDKFSTVLLRFGFVRCVSDYSVFVKRTKRDCIILVVYVDDIVITGNDTIGIQETQSWLQSKLQIKDLGVLQYFLGIEVSKKHEGIFLSQKKYILDMLDETRLYTAKTADTPLEAGIKLMPDEGQEVEDPSKYKRLAGKLIYLIVT